MSNIVHWKNYELETVDYVGAQINGGRLQKFWVEDIKSGRQFLIKASGYLSYEPFSEKIAYIIGKNLGFDVLKYDIIPSELFKDFVNTNPFCKYASICERIDKKGYSITTIAEIKRARNIVRPINKKPFTNKEIMMELLPKEYIDRMILFDAIIGNKDRNYGNIHLLRNTKGKIKPAPLLDNGDSLLASSLLLLDMIHSRKIGEYENQSSMIFKTQDGQMSMIDTLDSINYNIPAKTIQILLDIEPILKLMNPFRAQLIRKYISYRLHKYLGMLKESRRININTDEELKVEKEYDDQKRL